ncbi:Lipopolysaccharide export system ATP-binding protein LptB [Sesbania bispinosa]|nr:Lipopolysaccharide export system ATP-binding protein LptB [Sesbania bispinosa]
MFSGLGQPSFFRGSGAGAAATYGDAAFGGDMHRGMPFHRTYRMQILRITLIGS